MQTWNNFVLKIKETEENDISIIIPTEKIEILRYINKPSDSQVFFEIIGSEYINAYNNDEELNLKKCHFSKEKLHEKIIQGLETEEIVFGLKYVSSNGNKNIVFISKEALSTMCAFLNIKTLKSINKVNLMFFTQAAIMQNTLLYCKLKAYGNGNYVVYAVNSEIGETRGIVNSELIKSFAAKIPEFKLINYKLGTQHSHFYIEFPGYVRQGIRYGLCYEWSSTGRGSHLYVTAATQANENTCPVYVEEIGKFLSDFTLIKYVSVINNLRTYDNEKMIMSLFLEKSEKIDLKSLLGKKRVKKLEESEFPKYGTQLEIIKNFIDLPNKISELNDSTNNMIKNRIGSILLKDNFF